MTIQEFIQSDPSIKSAKDILSVVNPILEASTIIAEKLSMLNDTELIGYTGGENTYGEAQQKLDIYANELLIKKLSQSSVITALASEENEHAIKVSHQESGYVVGFDPLDGSSNIDVNVPVGTIFTVLKQINRDNIEANFLQKGEDQKVAGYVMYGASTILVISFGNGTHMFLLDKTKQAFILFKKNFKTPKSGDIYSINESNDNSYHEGITNYLNQLKTKEKTTARFVGAMVTDVHRNLIKGGLFCYPAIKGYPNGKLRLIFEANPMAYIVQQAGGGSSLDGLESILNLTPTNLHQRVPVILGSKEMVLSLCKSMQEKNTNI